MARVPALHLYLLTEPSCLPSPSAWLYEVLSRVIIKHDMGVSVRDFNRGGETHPGRGRLQPMAG